jgi:multiple sugar transport system ATP-binding protein
MILVGPSGCGKSTLLRMIVGLEDITSGDMLIGGERVNDLAPRDRNLAMVFQNYALYPHLTVFENIAFPLRLNKGASKRGDPRGSTRPRRPWSSPSTSTASPATSPAVSASAWRWAARSSDADAFLFDEPLSNLDAKLRGQMRTEILADAARHGHHDRLRDPRPDRGDDPRRPGRRAAKGILQQVASPRELYEQPVNLFVAGFIGSPPMNFLPARVEGGNLKLPFVDVPVGGALAEKIRGKDLVIVGIRPEHLKDATLGDSVPDNAVRFTVPVDVTEWLGNEQYAYVPYDQPDAAVQSKLEELDRELDGEGMRTQMVVNLDSRSRVREGDDAELLFDPALMHVFDPESGTCLTRDEDKARQIAEENEADRKRALERAKAREAAAAGRTQDA